MAIIAAIIAFALAFFFKGEHVTSSVWLDWQSLVIIGLFLVAVHLAIWGPAPVSTPFRRAQPGVTE